MIKVPGPRILLKPIKLHEEDKVFASAKKYGIVISEQTERQEQTKIDKGIVLSIGPTAAKEYVQGVEVGDVVGFAKYGGKFVVDPVDEETYLVINDEDIVCIFKDHK